MSRRSGEVENEQHERRVRRHSTRPSVSTSDHNASWSGLASDASALTGRLGLPGNGKRLFKSSFSASLALSSLALSCVSLPFLTASSIRVLAAASIAVLTLFGSIPFCCAISASVSPSRNSLHQVARTHAQRVGRRVQHQLACRSRDSLLRRWSLALWQDWERHALERQFVNPLVELVGLRLCATCHP